MLSSIEVRANPVAITGMALMTSVLLMTHLAPNLGKQTILGNAKSKGTKQDKVWITHLSQSGPAIKR
jgi:hypothetical protein